MRLRRSMAATGDVRYYNAAVDKRRCDGLRVFMTANRRGFFDTRRPREMVLVRCARRKTLRRRLRQQAILLRLPTCAAGGASGTCGISAKKPEDTWGIGGVFCRAFRAYCGYLRTARNGCCCSRSVSSLVKRTCASAGSDGTRAYAVNKSVIEMAAREITAGQSPASDGC